MKSKITLNKKLIIIFIITILLLISLIYTSYNIFFDKSSYLYSSNSRLEMDEVYAATLYPGKVDAYYVKEGQYVKKDTNLVKLVASEIESNRNIAMAARQRAVEAQNRAIAQKNAMLQQLKVSNIDYKNALELSKQKIVSKVEVIKRKAQVDGETLAIDGVSAAINEAKAAISEADANINKIDQIENDMLLKSPIDGLVEYKLIELGSVVPAGAKIVSLLDYQNIYINLYLPIKTIAKIKLNDEVRIKVDGIDAIFPGNIIYVSTSSEFTPNFVETKSERDKLMYNIKVKIPNNIAIKYHTFLKSGLTCDVFVKMDNNRSWTNDLNIKLP